MLESNTVNGVRQRLRAAAYEYDYDHNLNQPAARAYRLTCESLFDASSNALGTITHIYDAVGNRTTRQVNLTFNPADPNLASLNLAYNARDEIVVNGYPVGDANGNTVTNVDGTATGDLYDAENHLVQRVGLHVGYDCDGNRAWKGSTYYLLDDRNPSGYVQVLAEYPTLSGGPPSVMYAWGLDLVSEEWQSGSTYYYGYDGQGSVRQLLDASVSANVVNSYDYEGYGMLLTNNATVLNRYLYTGQQWDSDLGCTSCGQGITHRIWEGSGRAIPLRVSQRTRCPCTNTSTAAPTPLITVIRAGKTLV